ncbi:hypothetical protein QYE76_057941 [Lolium multiflorum]|uniref:Reverse transcriptase RNase H-like domain-containing protein n=1 Tax=Lolium multiflorum TaxID=4521 RepID=A0AAD8T4R2_LOLMU|nr:hypothetical protein QYE76_057941 [Lolium multiflorum]
MKSLMLKCPIHELPSNIVTNNFYARLTLHDKDLLDASCSGSFTCMKEEAKWDLLDRIQENTVGWENDKGRKSGQEEERLLGVLKKHRGAMGHTLDDLNGISPTICQHAINMEPDAKPVVEHQRRFIPKMKDMRCEEINLVLNWEKCHFIINEGIVLGHKISERAIEVDRAKVEAIEKMPCPRDVKGAVLGQRVDKKLNVIHYASKTLDAAQNNYATAEKEFLAVVFACDKFRPYIVNLKVTIHTDHAAIRGTMISTNNDKGKELPEGDLQNPKPEEEAKSEAEERK